MLKALSPLIAVMILIAVVVGIGVTLSGWITQMISRTSRGVSTCSLEADYVIEKADFRIASGILSIKITNTGNLKLYGFGVIAENETDTLIFPPASPEISTSPSITEKSKLEKGRSAYINLDLSSYPGMGISLYRVTVSNELCPEVKAVTNSITLS